MALGEDVTDCFGALGVISARSNTIYELARALVQGELHLDISVHPEEEMKKLMNIRGIGSWTAKYIAMRAMEWPDSFLETDAGVKKALPGLYAKRTFENGRSMASVAQLCHDKFMEYTIGGIQMYYSTTYPSPIGLITLACDGAGEHLVGLWMEGQKYHGDTIPEAMVERNAIPLFDTTKKWLDRYFTGKKT